MLSFAEQFEKQMGLLMLVREPYVSSTSDKPQLNICMHEEQAVQQSITKQAASSHCGVDTAKGQTDLGRVEHVRG